MLSAQISTPTPTALVLQNKEAKHISPVVSYDTKSKVDGRFDEPTLQQFGAYVKAYHFFNGRLFNNELPPVLLTLQEKRKAAGYFRPDSWYNAEGSLVSEIAVNPKYLCGTPMEVFSTLVHEMCHHYQAEFLNPSRNGYHNKQFARIMRKVGLMCSDTGLPGGKTTGQRMSDYPIAGGAFLKALAKMPDECLLPFTRLVLPSKGTALSTSSRNKIAYCCPGCQSKVWGRPRLNLLCGECNFQYLPQLANN